MPKTPPIPKSKPKLTKSAMDKLSPADYKKVMAIVDRANKKAKSPSPAEMGKARDYAKKLTKPASKHAKPWIREKLRKK